jgi:HD-GYP domain-containing protein (c-di-GMP phosphodiesterase class II)
MPLETTFVNLDDQALFKQACKSSLVRLANAIELRDVYTRGHVERVMYYSISIARLMGWEGKKLQALQFGSILHDVGKIHIRENILRKPGSLNQKEWMVMKRHPVLGAELIQNIPYLSIAVPVVRHHHEYWDGSGYPDRLGGEEIPEEARIVTVADALDAMTTQRVYQAAGSPVQAYGEIVNGSGSRYDPRVVEAFREAWGQIQASLANLSRDPEPRQVLSKSSSQHFLPLPSMGLD